MTGKGIITVGTGTGASDGDINVSDAGSATLAIKRALERSKRIVILPGVYDIATPIDITEEDQTIEAYGATFRPTSTTTSQGQLFEITGDGVRLLGGRVELTQFTDAQYVIRGNAANELLVSDLIVDDQIRPSSYTTSMKLFRLDGCYSPTIRNVHVMPDKGLMVYSGRNCYSITIDNPMTGERWVDEKLCDTLYDFNDCTHSLIRGGYAFGLGSASTKMSFVLRAYNTSGSVHHVRVDGGYYESIMVSRGFQVEGGRHGEFENMSVASFTETDVGVFCAIGSTGDATGTAVTNFELANIRSHDNCKSGSNGALLYARKANRVVMDNCRHVEAYTQMARLDTTNVDTCIIRNSFAHSTQAAASFATTQDACTYINSSSVTNWHMRDNIAVGSSTDGFQAWHTTPPTGVDELHSRPKGLRITRTAGAANGANVTVTGITTSDTLARVINITDKVEETITNYTVGAGVITQTTGATSGDTLIVEWYDA